MSDNVARMCLVTLMIAAITSTACSGFSERYYVRSHEGTHVKPIYYRVTIRGSAIFSTSRYSSGFFDRAAVEQLFGERQLELARQRGDLMIDLAAAERDRVASANVLVARTKKLFETIATRAEAAASSESPQVMDQLNAMLDAAKTNWQAAESAREQLIMAVLERRSSIFDSAGRPVDTENQKFVIFMTANNQALADAISSIVEEQANTENLVALLTSDQRRRLESAKLESERDQRRAREVIDVLENAGDQATALDLLREASKPFGGWNFSTVDEARRWLDANRNRFLKE